MTITEYRNRFHDTNAKLRRARFDNDTEAIEQHTAELHRILDEYNRSHTCSD